MADVLDRLTCARHAFCIVGHGPTQPSNKMSRGREEVKCIWTDERISQMLECTRNAEVHTVRKWTD